MFTRVFILLPTMETKIEELLNKFFENPEVIFTEKFKTMSKEEFNKQFKDKEEKVQAKPNESETPEAQQFRIILGDMLRTYLKKSKDYGNSYEKSYQRFGEKVGMLFPMYTKMDRLNELLSTDKKPENESIEDTLLDLANYAILGLIHLKNKKYSSK